MISCLMVTLPTTQRIAFAKRSIDLYCRQTYPDRELIVVVDSAAPETAPGLLAHIASLDRPDIRVETPRDRLSLGALRNLSIEIAGGDVLCQWDDDDLHHPTRLERQFAILDRGDHQAVLLQEVIQYFPDRHAIYLTNWRATPAAGHPGTLMARSAADIRYPEHGEKARRGEDLEVARALVDRGVVGYLRDEPHLYLYVSHGGNTWADDHHQMLARALSVSRALLCRREAAVRAGLAAFGFAADSVDAVGNNGIAFRM